MNYKFRRGTSTDKVTELRRTNKVDEDWENIQMLLINLTRDSYTDQIVDEIIIQTTADTRVTHMKWMIRSLGREWPWPIFLLNQVISGNNDISKE